MANSGSGRSLTVHCDGASRGNPGPASFGFAVYEAGEIVAEGNGKLGNTTNNVAEYYGLLRGLEKCVALGASHVTVKTDSELMVRQLNGIYKVKAPALVPLFQKAKDLLTKFEKPSVVHVRREENKRADQLANWALDGVVLPGVETSS